MCVIFCCLVIRSQEQQELSKWFMSHVTNALWFRSIKASLPVSQEAQEAGTMYTFNFYSLSCKDGGCINAWKEISALQLSLGTSPRCLNYYSTWTVSQWLKGPPVKLVHQGVRVMGSEVVCSQVVPVQSFIAWKLYLKYKDKFVSFDKYKHQC